MRKLYSFMVVTLDGLYEGPDRFDGVGYRENKQGIPVLDGVLAHIECEKRTAIPAGDHTVFLGLVVGGSVTDRRPLLYYRGGYASLRE